jgi:hypothetical protein
LPSILTALLIAASSKSLALLTSTPAAPAAAAAAMAAAAAAAAGAAVAAAQGGSSGKSIHDVRRAAHNRNGPVEQHRVHTAGWQNSCFYLDVISTQAAPVPRLHQGISRTF